MVLVFNAVPQARLGKLAGPAIEKAADLGCEIVCWRVHPTSTPGWFYLEVEVAEAFAS